jgi:hypothetical protein
MAFLSPNHPKPETGHPAMETLLLNLERLDPNFGTSPHVTARKPGRSGPGKAPLQLNPCNY